MERIYILTERIEWHNVDPEEEIRAYRSKADAKADFREKYNETVEYFTEERKDEIVHQVLNDEEDNRYFFTDRDDAYFIYITEVELN